MKFAEPEPDPKPEPEPDTPLHYANGITVRELFEAPGITAGDRLAIMKACNKVASARGDHKAANAIYRLAKKFADDIQFFGSHFWDKTVGSEPETGGHNSLDILKIISEFFGKDKDGEN